MTDVTQDMILDYILRKGGVVKNVELVRHFRKHLQVDDPTLKDRAREAFKERVNSVAFIKADHGDKFLHLRPEFQFKLSQPPPGRIPNGQRTSVSSSEDPFAPAPRTSSHYQRDSLLSDIRSPVRSPVRSPPVSSPAKAITTSKEPTSNSVAGISSPKTSAILSSYKPISRSPPPSSSIYSPPSKPQSSMDFGLGGSDFGLGGSDFGSSLLSEFGLLGNDTSSNVSSTSGLTGLSSSRVSSSTQQTGLSSSNVSSSTRQTGVSNSNVSSSTRQTGISSSSVSSSTQQTGLSSSSIGDTSSRVSGSAASVGVYTSNPRDSTMDPSRKTSSSSLMGGLGIKNVTQTSDRASSGYGSLGKSSDSTQSTVAPVTSSKQSSKAPPTSSFFDEFESMFSGLDTSLSLLTSGLSSTDTPSSSNGPSASHNSTSSKTVSSSNDPSYSHKSPPPKATNPSVSTTYSHNSPSTKDSASNISTGYSHKSPSPSSPGPVAPKPVRNSVISTSDTAQDRPPSSTVLGLTNGNAEIKQVTSRRPPPAPSPGPKRPAPKPPTRSSSNIKDGSSPLMTSTLDRHSTGGPQENHSLSTQSLGRPSHPHSRGGGGGGVSDSHLHNRGGGSGAGEAGQGLGSLGLDFLNSFGSFSTTAGSSLDSGPSQPPPPSQPPQPPPPSHASPPQSPIRYSSSSSTGRTKAQTDEAPLIRVDTPTKGSDTSSYNSGRVSPYEGGRGRSPTYTSLGPRPHTQDMEGLNSGPKAHHDSNERVHSSVVLRNRAPSNASSARRSRNFDKGSNLDNKTRHMIMATPPTARRSMHLVPPEVAPKPSSDSRMSRSREDVSQYGDEEATMSEPDYWDIDPYEKDWMLANAVSDMETIFRLLVTEPSLVNRRDFLHGYTAMHWAAKHGRCDVISSLHMNDAVVDLKSGLTPLHLAAASGHDNAIHFLVQECRADVNTRDHGGRRPVDVLSPKCSEKTKRLLSRIDNHGLPLPTMHWVENLSSFSRPRSGANLTRTWSSQGDIDRRHAIDTLKKHKSPKSIRKSFSFKRTRVSKEPTSPTRKEKKEKKNKRDKDYPRGKRPVSDAHAYHAGRNYDV